MRVIHQGEKDGKAVLVLFTNSPCDVRVAGELLISNAKNGDQFQVPVEDVEKVTLEESVSKETMPLIVSVEHREGNMYRFQTANVNGKATLLTCQQGKYIEIATVTVTDNEFDAKVPGSDKSIDFCVKIGQTYSPVVNFSEV